MRHFHFAYFVTILTSPRTMMHFLCSTWVLLGHQHPPAPSTSLWLDCYDIVSMERMFQMISSWSTSLEDSHSYYLVRCISTCCSCAAYRRENKVVWHLRSKLYFVSKVVTRLVSSQSGRRRKRRLLIHRAKRQNPQSTQLLLIAMHHRSQCAHCQHIMSFFN